MLVAPAPALPGFHLAVSEGWRFSGCGAGLGKPVRVGGLASALGMEPGLSLTRAGLGGGARVRTVPVALAFGMFCGRQGEGKVREGSI